MGTATARAAHRDDRLPARAPMAPAACRLAKALGHGAHAHVAIAAVPRPAAKEEPPARARVEPPAKAELPARVELRARRHLVSRARPANRARAAVALDRSEERRVTRERAALR